MLTLDPLSVASSRDRQTSAPAVQMSHEEAIIECTRVIEHHSKSFAFAARLLPPKMRADVAVLYTWCRRVDDAIDESSPEEARRQLSSLRRQLDDVYADEPSDRIQHDFVLRALRNVVERCHMPRHYHDELLAGMKMDVEGVHFRDLDTLYLYCYRVASVVGLMMCHIMGVKTDRALNYAAHLGLAMQLTNICRDVREDWGLGRLYLPAELLKETQTAQDMRSTQQLSTLLAHEHRSHGERYGDQSLPESIRKPAQEVTTTLLNHADHSYQLGYAGIAYLPWRPALAIHAAGMIYQDIGRVIRAQEADPLEARAFTTKARKLWLTARVLGVRAIKMLGSAFTLRWLRSSTLRKPHRTLTFAEFHAELISNVPRHIVDRDDSSQATQTRG